jgi:hypothetical protein
MQENAGAASVPAYLKALYIPPWQKKSAATVPCGTTKPRPNRLTFFRLANEMGTHGPVRAVQQDIAASAENWAWPRSGPGKTSLLYYS